LDETRAVLPQITPCGAGSTSGLLADAKNLYPTAPLLSILCIKRKDRLCCGSHGPSHAARVQKDGPLPTPHTLAKFVIRDHPRQRLRIMRRQIFRRCGCDAIRFQPRARARIILDARGQCCERERQDQDRLEFHFRSPHGFGRGAGWP